MKNKIPNRNKWAEKRYKNFNEKIDSFKGHEKYSWLREYANEAIVHNETSGYLMIKAEDFIKRIEKMPLEYIKGWIEGRNNLEWILQYK